MAIAQGSDFGFPTCSSPPPPSSGPVVRPSPCSPYFRADATQVATLFIDAACSDGCERDWRLGHAHMC